MALSRELVEKVSLLARLRLTEAELAMMTAQLGQIVDYFAMFSELDTEEVEPMAHAVELSNVFRDDVATASFNRAAILANAPHADGECYLVPAVLGE